MTGTVLTQESAQRQSPVSRYLLLDRNSDMERFVPPFDEGREPLAESTWTRKQIDNAESGGQVRLLMNFL